MVKARLSPAANLLRKSRLFALPQALTPPQGLPAARNVHESDSATLPHPIRAAIVTPGSSLLNGDWGLKRPLPPKTTSARSSRPVVRINALDTFEHTTDFESAADHTVTLEKFQELHLPISLPEKVSYSSGSLPRHSSPFESFLDNTNESLALKSPDAKKFRHSGPYLAGQTEAEFQEYLKSVRRSKPELMQKLRKYFIKKRTADRKKQAQDSGNFEGIDQPIKYTEAEFQTWIKSLRTDPFALGPVIFEILDLPPPPVVPSDMIGQKYYQPATLKLSSEEYVKAGPPKTHPSAGLSYTRTHALLYNHPRFGPQTFQRPVEARILRPKRFKGKAGRAVGGVAGIAVEDLNAMSFTDNGGLPGLTQYDASIPGGAKYWVNPIRASIDSGGRIELATFRATHKSRAPYGIEEYRPPQTLHVSPNAQGSQRTVMRLDRPRLQIGARSTSQDMGPPEERPEALVQSLMKDFAKIKA
ncbi:mitochondrial 37S ribosomal protein bS1m [Aspergillus saccharolyticus JOP 1030-1]|uniref:Mitochondrial ribosomal protein MRP51 n=1 Tax=Aspergillus saccharolyticus JOP 1030-1 TaxID=1450539 RepID=A0A319ALX2_9EURO|nr:hypothetical protein BP01DRAFT_354777 [Aspergillus saccharolyticus JOP 1030-1]PYH47572.1 hypothetical protein BP01DRAFT_354777 [Aspergillus saccharolyticus JOP 1030-1]